MKSAACCTAKVQRPGAETPVECPKDTGTEDVMGSTRFVYLDEDAGTGVAPLYEPAAGNVSGLYRRGGRNTGRGSGMQFVFGGNGTVEKKSRRNWTGWLLKRLRLRRP